MCAAVHDLRLQTMASVLTTSVTSSSPSHAIRALDSSLAIFLSVYAGPTGRPSHPPPPFVPGVDLDEDTLLYGYKPPVDGTHQQ